MTIHINKSLSEQVIRVTYDYYPNEGEEQILILKNDYTGEKYTINLGINQSTITYRMGEYLIDDTDTKDLPEGLYTYKVKDNSTSGCSTCPALCRGVAKVVVNCDVVSERKPVEYKDPKDNQGYITYED